MQSWKKTNPIIITLPEPCAEDWERMNPVGCGRFCDQCQKTVIDFTLFSDTQIVRMFAAHPDKQVCGKFHPGQLNRPVKLTEQKNHLAFKKIAAAGLFLASYFSALPVFAQNQRKQNTINIPAQEPVSSPIRINGIITDAYGNVPLIGMEISIPQLGKKYSDQKGRFSFTVPAALIGTQLKISAAYQPSSSSEKENSIILGETLTIDSVNRMYHVQLLRYPVTTFGSDEQQENNNNIIIEGHTPPSVKRTVTVMGGVGVVNAKMIAYKPGLFRRIKAIFRHKRTH